MAKVIPFRAKPSSEPPTAMQRAPMVGPRIWPNWPLKVVREFAWTSRSEGVISGTMAT